jgi:hypothetical protein
MNRFNLKIISLEESKLRYVWFAENTGTREDSMESVYEPDFRFIAEREIEKSDDELLNTSLIQLINDAFPERLPRDYGILVLHTILPNSYKAFVKDKESSNPRSPLYNHINLSRNERIRRGFDGKQDLFGWTTQAFYERDPLPVEIVIFPYPFNDIENEDGTYVLRDLPEEYLHSSGIKPKRTHFDVLLNISNRFIHLFYSDYRNLDIEEDGFRQKYLKYKTKYLNLLKINKSNN